MFPYCFLFFLMQQQHAWLKLTPIPPFITLSTVYPRSDRLCFGGPEPVWLPASGEPEDHPRDQAVRGPLLPRNLPQLQTWWKLRPAPVGSEEPHRWVADLYFWLRVCFTYVCTVSCCGNYECLKEVTLVSLCGWSNFAVWVQYLKKLVIIWDQTFLVCVFVCFYPFIHHLLGIFNRLGQLYSFLNLCKKLE